MQFFLPFSALPSNRQQRRTILDEYFPSDLIPFDELIDNQWHITSFIPDTAEFFIDPHLEKVLAEWNESVSIEEIGLYWRTYKNAFLSFNDSWSLLYWSLALKWLSLQTDELLFTLFHIDDHVDQGPPLLTLAEEGFSSIFSDLKISLSDPLSIEESLIEKSINIRSFITPLLHSLENIQVLHLRYAHSGEMIKRGLACTKQEDHLLAPGKMTPTISQTKEEGRHSYRIHSDFKLLLKSHVEDRPIFLHIDCDAFSNRYNGNSHWDKTTPTIDLRIDQIKTRITNLFDHISELSSQVFLNVALSPGFFPSEYWREVVNFIFEKGESANLIKDDEFSLFLKDQYPEKIYENRCLKTGFIRNGLSI